MKEHITTLLFAYWAKANRHKKFAILCGTSEAKNNITKLITESFRKIPNNLHILLTKGAKK